VQRPLNIAWLGLGANLGNPSQQLAEARQLLQHSGVELLSQSSLYHSPAWGRVEQPDFVNQVIKVQTSLLPLELLQLAKTIETQMGRTDTGKWGPRLIDIDILFYGQQHLDLPNLQIPHPFVQERMFCLQPLCELQPDLVHPTLNKTMQELKDALHTMEECS